MDVIKRISTPLAPRAIGPYSQAVIVGGFLFCSGQIAIDPKTNELITGGEKEQTQQILHNIHYILQEAKIGFERVVKVEIYLTNIKSFQEVNEAYAAVFSVEPLPSRTTVGVAELPKGALVEIACIALM